MKCRINAAFHQGLHCLLRLKQPSRTEIHLQEVFHVYLNKFEIVLSHLFLIIFSNNKFTLVNLISRNAQSPRK